MPDVDGHVLDVDSEGDVEMTHPENDVEECGFHDYVERDWRGDGVPRPSRWGFIRRTDDAGTVNWLGSRLDHSGGAFA